MKAILLCTCFVLISFIGRSQQQNPFVTGFEKSIQSNVLNEERKVWIHLPKSGSGKKTMDERYPVIYLLDGNENFNDVVSQTEFMASAGVMPPTSRHD